MYNQMKNTNSLITLFLTAVSIIHLFRLPDAAAQNFGTDVSFVSVNVMSNEGFIAFSVQLEIPGDTSLGPQHMMFDTGSSSLVFCNKKIRNLLNVITPLDYPGDSNVLYLGKEDGQCIGNSFLMANSYGANPEKSYQWGYVYKGDLLITNNGDKDYSNARKMENVAFGIAEEHGSASICSIGFDGIWGAGFFRSGNLARVPISNNVLPSDVLCFQGLCSSETFDPVDDWCNCEGTDSTVYYLYPALEKTLRNAGSPIIGIYMPASPLEFSSLLKSKITYNAGMLFTGDDAIHNKHYQNPAHAKVTSDNDGQHRYWSIPMTSIQVFCGSASNPNLSFPVFPLKDFCVTNQCFLDTGVPKNVFPKSIVDQINSCTDKNGSVRIQMDGGELIMDMQNLKTLEVLGASESYAGHLILGFPTWLWYYTVFDFGSNTEGSAEITFIYTPPVGVTTIGN